jgi:prepilin-type N-terminal cleavage/methylation domain-containing protein
MGGERGFSLLENLVALAIFGIIAIGFLSGLTLGLKSNIINNEQTTAETLAKNQIEYIQQQPYSDAIPPVYSVISELPAGYTINTTATYLDPNGLQKITVTVQRNTRTVFALEDYKVKR